MNDTNASDVVDIPHESSQLQVTLDVLGDVVVNSHHCSDLMLGKSHSEVSLENRTLLFRFSNRTHGHFVYAGIHHRVTFSSA